MRAIHNGLGMIGKVLKVFPICQRYDMRAIHNTRSSTIGALPGVSNMSKIRYESNSQLHAVKQYRCHGCFQYVKDTI